MDCISNPSPYFYLEGFLLHCKVPSILILKVFLFPSLVPQEHCFPILEGFIFFLHLFYWNILL